MEDMLKEFSINGNKYLFDGRTINLYKIPSKFALNLVIDRRIDTPYLVSKQSTTELKKLTINMANLCNLKCRYCYAHGGNYNRKNSLITTNTINKIINELKKLNYTNIKYVNFFGGEALLNFHTIKYAVDKLDMNFNVDKYSIVTNGTILNIEIAEFLKKHNFHITISLDGPEKIHNFLRGAASHEKIMQTIEVLKKFKVDKEIELSCTYTPYHIEQGIDKENLKQYFRNLGFKYNISNVFSHEQQFKFKNKTKVEKIYKNIDDSFHWIMEKEVFESINPIVYDVLHSLIYKNKNYGFCDELSPGFGLSYDYDGSKYYCFRFWGKTEYCLDNALSSEIYDKITNKIYYNMCENCWARYLCRECSANILEGYVGNEIGIVNAHKCIKLDYYEYTIKKICYLYEEKYNFQVLAKNFKEFS